MSTKTKKLRMDEYSPDKKQSHGVDKRRELDNVIKKARRDNDASQNLFWNKKLLEAEEKEPNRWRHTGFKELYIDDDNASKTKSPDDDRTSVGNQKKSEDSPMRRSRHGSLSSPVNDRRRTYSSSSLNNDRQRDTSPSPRLRTDKFGSSRRSSSSPREKSLSRKKPSQTPPANDLHDEPTSSATSQKQAGRRKKCSPDRSTRTPVRERSTTGKTRSPTTRTRRSLSAVKRGGGSPARKRSLSRTSPLTDRRSSRRKSTPRGTPSSTGRTSKRRSPSTRRGGARSSSRRKSPGNSRRRSPPVAAPGRTPNNRSKKGGSRSRSPLVSRRRTRSPIPPRRRTRSPIPSRRRTRSPIPARRRTRSPIPPRRRSRSSIVGGSYRRLSSRRTSDTRIRSPPVVARRMRSRTPIHFDRSTPLARKPTTSRYRAGSSSVNRSSPYRRKSPVSAESSYRKRSVATVDHPKSSRHYGSPNGSAYNRSKTTAVKNRRTRSNSPSGYKVDRKQRYNNPSPEASSSSSVCSDPNCNLCLADKEIPKKTDPTPTQSLISPSNSPVAVVPPSAPLLSSVGHSGKRTQRNVGKSKRPVSLVLSASKSRSPLPVVLEPSSHHRSRTPHKERSEKRASKKKKSKKRDKQQKIKPSEAIASNVIHRKRIKVESVSDDSETTAAPRKPTLSERFGKMAHHSNVHKESSSNASHNRSARSRRTEKYSIPSPIPARIEEPDPYIAPPPPPQSAPLHSKFNDHSPSLILENIWEDVRTRYAYYKERGYLQDLSFQDYIKWEEWWYQSLEEERGLDRLNFPHM